MYGWAQAVQDRLSSQLLPVAHAAGAGTEVVVDLQHSTLRVVIPHGTSAPVTQAVRAAVLATPVGQTLHARRWAVVVAPPHVRPYSSHVDWSQVAKPRRIAGGDVCVLVLSRDEVDALRVALGLLRHRASNARVVATFAMGGLPLLHWLAVPPSGNAIAAASALARAPSYCLFAGLNWSNTAREKIAFKAWLAGELATPGHVLVFDTGTHGNGVRQAGNLACEAVAACAPVAGASVAITGLIDGPSRETEHHKVRGMNGVEVGVTIDFVRVPHLPTEDNGLLLGYDADRNAGVLHPVAGFLLYRIEEAPPLLVWMADCIGRDTGSQFEWLLRWVERCRRRFTRCAVVATSSGAITIADLVSGQRRPQASWLRRDDREWGAAAVLLAHAQASELEALDNAIAAGLVATPVRDRVVTQHTREQAELLTRLWNRNKKRVVVLGVERR